MTVQIKFCGITRAQDVTAVLDLRVDAMGLNFYSGSARFVDVETAQALARQAGSAVVKVGVFVDPERDYVERILRGVDLDVLQFHGDEDDAFCAGFDKPYWKAVQVREPQTVKQLSERYPHASAFLLDAWDEQARGGTGHTFDWLLWPEDAAEAAVPLWLAGGLDSSNVAHAMKATRPFGVDVSGGIEGATKGRKDRNAMMSFVQEVRGAQFG